LLGCRIVALHNCRPARRRCVTRRAPFVNNDGKLRTKDLDYVIFRDDDVVPAIAMLLLERRLTQLHLLQPRRYHSNTHPLGNRAGPVFAEEIFPPSDE
jgi:hypothetical protein